jgi:hypothetical protein
MTLSAPATRKCRMDSRRPNAFSSHTTTKMTTTAFKIDLIDRAIGMNVFTSQRRIPTTISDSTTCSKGMIIHLHGNGWINLLADSAANLFTTAQQGSCGRVKIALLTKGGVVVKETPRLLRAFAVVGTPIGWECFGSPTDDRPRRYGHRTAHGDRTEFQRLSDQRYFQGECLKNGLDRREGCRS